MSEKSFWGNITPTKITNLVSPFAILEKQGEQLAKGTAGELSGRTVRGGQYGNEFVIDFYIYAPKLGQYTYPVLKVTHGLGMYPLRLREHGEHDEITCKDVDEFETTLKNILSSERIHNVINSLLAQMPD
tara:strand:- start:265 stop:654 length:390 start_codon:yes stop_codon:yes gene_type:complete